MLLRRDTVAFTGAAICLLLALAVNPGSGGTPTPVQGALPSSASAEETSPTVILREAVTGNGRSLPEKVIIIHLGDSDEEYDEEYEEGETITDWPSPGVTKRLCDYDRCRQGQKPCAELQRLAEPSQPCLCPGMAGDDTTPDPPELLPPTAITDSSVRLHWCEPLSAVHGYRLLLSDGGVGGGVEVIDGAQLARSNLGGHLNASRHPTLTSEPLAPDTRLHTLSGLRSATTYQVCVAAYNTAGVSSGLEEMKLSESESVGPPTLNFGPCRRFTTKPSRYLLAAIGSSAVLVLVLLVASVAVCFVAQSRRRRQLAGKQQQPEEGAVTTTTTTSGVCNLVYQGPVAVTSEAAVGPSNQEPAGGT